MLGIPHVSYKGCDLESANEWNRGLYESFQRFPELQKQFGFVGECHERNALIKEALYQSYLEPLKQKFPNHPLSMLEEAAKKQVAADMRAFAISSRTMAESYSTQQILLKDFQGITVNRAFGKDSSAFSRSLSENVTSKFHPDGCTTIRSILDHEIGHQLDTLLDIRTNASVQQLYGSKTCAELTDGLSRYAWDNSNPNAYSEMIAEAWAEYCNNANPRPIAKQIGEIIEDEYRKKFGGA